MTKKQKKIYDWLMSKPGYIKKSYFRFLEATPTTLSSKHEDFEIARTQARKDYNAKKSASANKPVKNVTTEIVRDAMKVVSKDVRPLKVVRSGLVISDSVRRVNTPGWYFIFGCVHAPFHHKRAFTGVSRLLKDNKDIIKGIVFAGDYLDMNSLSSHDKGKKPIKGVTLDWEYLEGQNLLDQIFEHLPSNIHKIFIYGNHEDRYLRYMSDIDNSKLGDSLPSPEVGLDLQNRGFRVFNNWKQDVVTLGNYLDVSHGEFTNVHTAKKHIDTYRRSTLYYHTHRIQQYIEGQVGGFNGGSMADFDQPVFNYATRAMKNSWLNGFTGVYIDEQGYYHIQQIMIYNNRFVFGNKIYVF